MLLNLQHRSDQPAQPRKLMLKKETLRQLTDGELRLVAGGALAGTSVISVSSGTSVISSGTSVIITSGGNPSGGSISGH